VPQVIDKAPNLVYVFIGDTLPDYVTPSLRLTRRFFRGEMVLLTNARNTPVVEGVVVEDFTPWYRPDAFSKFVEKSPLNKTFRGGFWLFTAERFFVLSQYMTTKKVTKLFHAELDNVVFNLDGVATELDGWGAGIFYPTDTGGAGLGTLVYCNNSNSLDDLTDFMAENSHLGDEMTLLGHYVKKKPSMVHALSSATVFGRDGVDIPSIGLFDAQTIGQWLFGIDPANTVYTTYNKAHNPNSPDDLTGVKFFLSTKNGQLFAQTKSTGRLPIHNLHVHSKIFSRLLRRGALRAYFAANRLPTRVPIVIAPGHWRHRLLTVLINRSRRGLVRAFSVSRAGQSLLRFLVASSRVPLSNRQLKAFHSLLPSATKMPNISPHVGVALLTVSEKKSSLVISCSMWKEKQFSPAETGLGTSPPDESHTFNSPLEALDYLLNINIDSLMVHDQDYSSRASGVGSPPSGDALWPDKEKPQWEPQFELPIFPHRSRAVTFTSCPQLISLERLREVFGRPDSRHRWAKQVRPDTFVAALLNAYGQHLLISKNKPALLRRSD
jgi:hypothetical protein